MNAVILKYFNFEPFENDIKFSYEVAFAKTNEVLKTLTQTPSIKNISVVVPDREFDAAIQFIRIASSRISMFSKINELYELSQDTPVLFIDEQALYSEASLLEKMIHLANQHDLVCWSDPQGIVSSFCYTQEFYYFFSPGALLRSIIGDHESFFSLFWHIQKLDECFHYEIDSIDIRLIYGQCVKYNPLPWHYVIEPTSRCDSRCIMCPFHSPDPEIAKGGVYLGTGGEDMPLSVFKRLIDEIVALPWPYLPIHRTPMVTPQLRGESLLSQDFKSMCSYAKEKGLRLSLSTNGNNLNKNNYINFFLDIGYDEIVVSLDAERKIFSKVRPQLDYDTIINNLKSLYTAKLDRGCVVPKIYTKTVMLKDHPPLDLRKTAQAFSEFADSVGFAYENYVNDEGTKEFSNYFFPVDETKHVPCLSISDVVGVHSDGLVKLCHADTTANLGNIHQNNLMSIVKNSSLRNKLLNDQIKGNFNTQKACKTCTTWYAQYRTIENIGDFIIIQNPILTYWEKTSSFKHVKQAPIVKQKLLFDLYKKIKTFLFASHNYL
jgi:radical SAM protein with 4Fe4S-binding SPASM domain